jgi:hypothetical protein
MSHAHITKKDLDIDEKKVLGRIIDMWSLGDDDDPYAYSTESEVIKYSEKDGVSVEKTREVLKSLESLGFIRRQEEEGKTVIKYMAGASQIVKELQGTTFVQSRNKFKPPHH